MNNFNDIKQLWHKQEVTDLPNVKAVIEKAISFRKKARFNIIKHNVILTLTAIYITFVLFYYKPEFFTTKLGVIIAVIAIVMAVIIQSNMLQGLFKSSSSEENSHQYLQKMIRYKSQMSFFQTKIMKAYFILLSLGMGLYLYEYAIRMQWPYAVLVYLVTFGWIGLAWVKFVPKQAASISKGINEVIEQLERVNNQLVEKDAVQ
ncbi:hypothetical protein C3K47_02620 [Solitalea longa]|uniref:Uncharacterized protein n=1 Tax=Solitalea longa TaxID=2079460 RepID=A0A2S5A6U3_9SPHI|nr:hypothetical protein [Solitalea longa]POY38311.1 hypothetical protein C3K47_02620 [Solitalea longa]